MTDEEFKRLQEDGHIVQRIGLRETDLHRLEQDGIDVETCGISMNLEIWYILLTKEIADYILENKILVNFPPFWYWRNNSTTTIKQNLKRYCANCFNMV